MPAVTEPLIAWITSGEAEAQEREDNGPWVTSHLKKVRCSSRRRARLTSSGGERSPLSRLRSCSFCSACHFSMRLWRTCLGRMPSTPPADVSGFEDQHLIPLLQQLREEAQRPAASRLFVRGIAQAIAIHLARNYTALTEAARGETSSLPGFKLRRVTDWMAEHMAEEFSLGRLAEQADMSEFHFNRLFKRATGVPPSQYQIKLRMDAARRLLRETKRA